MVHRAANAVEADHVCPGLLRLPARIGRAGHVAHGAFPVNGEGHQRGKTSGPDGLQGQQRLAGPAEGLGDDEVHAGLGRPAHLLLESRPDSPLSGRSRLVDVRVAQVAGQQRARFPRYLGGDGQGLPVERLEDALLADHPQLLAVTVVRERLHHVGAGVHELPVQTLDDLGVLQHDLGDERACLQVSPALALEEVALGADDRALSQQLQQIRHAILQARLVPRQR